MKKPAPHTLRPACFQDLEALYDVCLRTADAGGDASHLFGDVTLLGDLYVGGYLAFSGGWADIIEDAQGMAGYRLMTLDARAYQVWFRKQWLPQLRTSRGAQLDKGQAKHLDESLLDFLWDEEESYQPPWMNTYPSELHLSILPRLQRLGLGSKILQQAEAWLRSKASQGVHVGLNPDNHRARLFFEALGYEFLELADLPTEQILYLGKSLIES